jgi:type I restriction enzyme, S subunit
MVIVDKQYRKTGVGYIPSDWSVVSLGDNCVKIGSGITPTGGEKNYKETGRPFIRSQNIGWGKLLLDDVVFIDESTHQTFNSTELKLNDVLLNITGASIGRSAIADKHVIGGNVNQHVCIIRTTQSIHPRFLNYFLLSENGQKQIESFQAGGNRQGLNFEQIRSFRIVIPPTLEEQISIADAIGDADSHIAALEKIITKKRDIKQGVMQLLLRPKNSWEEKKLGEEAVLKARIGWQGLTTAEYRSNGDYYLVTGTEFKNGFIDWDRCVYVDFDRFKQDVNIQLRLNDVLVTKDGTIGKVAFVTALPKKATLNSGVFVIRPKVRGVDQRYLYYVLLSKQFNEFLGQLTAGSTISHLYQKDFVHFTFSAPNNEQQRQIAEVLADMDAEIDALGKKLEKQRYLKQGMMQNLLTGKIRLMSK